mgnify:CR=1 FL=1
MPSCLYEFKLNRLTMVDWLLKKKVQGRHSIISCNVELTKILPLLFLVWIITYGLLVVIATISQYLKDKPLEQPEISISVLWYMIVSFFILQSYGVWKTSAVLSVPTFVFPVFDSLLFVSI